MIKDVSLELAITEYVYDSFDVFVYKKFARSAQWSACQTWPAIIQAIAKFSQLNVKSTEEC